MLNQRMLKRYGDNPVKDAVIKEVRQTTETTNEFLSTVNQRATAETGYDKYHLNAFRDLETPLEQSVIDRIKEKLSLVQDFEVAWMSDLSTEVRCQLVDFAADVIEQHQS